jgi:hypothetical protein
MSDIARGLEALSGHQSAGSTITSGPGTLESLWRSAAHTKRIWTCHAESSPSRDLGAEVAEPIRRFAIGSRVAILIDADTDGHLLFLDRGTSGRIYCLCPSPYAPETRIRQGLNRLPQRGSKSTGFLASGSPGREQLLAIVTRSPLDLGWDSVESATGARLLSVEDEAALLAKLTQLPDDEWQMLSTAFLIVP